MATKQAAPSVLFVDDSSQDLELVKAAFEEARSDAQIRCVQTVAAAKAYLLGRPPYDNRGDNPAPTIVLLDIQIPGEDGFALLSWLRGRKEDWRQVPVIMLTASHAFSAIRKAYDAGANSFLVKPAGFDELVKMVTDLSRFWLKHNRQG
jgi:DNA-binding response OmpR family regulator